MSAVYSTQLGAMAIGASEALFGPWPGYRVIVTDVEWTNAEVDDETFSYAVDVGTDSIFAGVQWSSGGAPTSQWTGRVVLTDGGQLDLEASANVSCLVSGYLLTLP
jgi:hypothetical protein